MNGTIVKIVDCWNITAAFWLHGVLRCVRRHVVAPSELAALDLVNRALRIAGADVMHVQIRSAA